MRRYYKHKPSKITFKTHRKHRSKKEGGKHPPAMSIYTRRWFV